MRHVALDGTFGSFRTHARALARSGVEPDAVRWSDPLRGATDAPAASLFGDEPAPREPEDAPPLSLPKAFSGRMTTVACHRSADVWPVLYRLLFRVVRGQRDVLDDPLDPDVVRFQRMEKAVRRDAHKMHAFVRFRRVDDPGARNGERFVAWYEPSHLICERESRFFRERFPSMDWSILTPDASAHWDGDEVRMTEGAPRSAAPTDDELEELWCAYYASVFNPARVKVKAMEAEMPRKFWHTLPETAQIPDLLADVPRRLEDMARTSRRMADSAMPFVPAGAELDELGRSLSACEGCELCGNGTRPVPGEGPATARVVLLGEQPGDMEERAGRPFVGPAGQVLDRALEDAGVDRSALYVTNAVKHFRHEAAPRGKRRLHKRPTIEHVTRCQPWFDAEMDVVRPGALVCLGVTAARSVFGPTFRMPAPGEGPKVRSSRYAACTLVTFHPAAVLRAPDAARAEAMGQHIRAALRLALERSTSVTRAPDGRGPETR